MWRHSKEDSLRLAIGLVATIVVALSAGGGSAEKSGKKTGTPSASPHGGSHAEPPGAGVRSTDRAGEKAGEQPIDTRISVVPSLTKRPPPGGEKKTIGAPSPPVSFGRLPLDAGAARNAIGARVESNTNPKGTLPGAFEQIPRPHFGSTGTGIIARPPSNHPSSSSPTSSPVLPAPGYSNRAVITGTGMNRPGTGPASLGGPAKNAAAINGTSIRPKH